MALPGTRIGPYEILAPIGAGGMGEVYRARDTRLNRDVAVKVLPEALQTTVIVWRGSRARRRRWRRSIIRTSHRSTAWRNQGRPARSSWNWSRATTCRPTSREGGYITIANYDVLPDGGFVMTEAEPGPPRLTVVLNWFEAMKRQLASPVVR